MFSLNVRKSKMLKKCNNFFRKTFSFIKVSLWASRKQYCLPRSKSFVKQPKLFGSQYSTLMKKAQAQFFLNFSTKSSSGHVNMQFVYTVNFFMRNGWSFLCQMSESQRRSCNFFEKQISNWSYGQVERSFDTIAGKSDIRSKVLAPCLKLILKSIFFQKFLFS